MDFVTNGEVDSDKKEGKRITGLFESSIGKKPILRNTQKHFKAFYFAEHGYSAGGGYVSGYSNYGADYVVVFKSKNNQTAGP